jgi:membrane protein
LGVIGFAILIYTVIALMQKIESSFNFIWRVGQGRSFARRFGDYLTVLFVGPLAIFLSTSATTLARHSDIFQHFESLPGMGAFVSGLYVLIPWLVLAMGFSAMYIFMPNTRVRFYPAFVGGLFAALIWKFMGFVFATFVASSGSYIAIYAAFASLILFIIWLYIGWMVVLLGADIAFYVQKPRFVRISRKPLILSPYLTRAYGLAVTYHIGKAHHNRAHNWTTEGLAAAIDAPVLAIEQVINALCEAKLVVASSDKDPLWYPGVAYATTPLKSVTDALDHYGTSGHLGQTHPKLPVNVEELLARYNKTLEDDFLMQPIEKALGIL